MHPNLAEVNKLRLALQNFPANLDGPTARVQQLIQHPVFGPTVNRFLQGQLNPQKWQHQLREDYRTHVWKILTRDRPQNFAGTSGGVDRPKTLALLKILMQQADELQSNCDADLEINPDPLEDPRAKLKGCVSCWQEACRTPSDNIGIRNNQVRCYALAVMENRTFCISHGIVVITKIFALPFFLFCRTVLTNYQFALLVAQ